MAMRSFQCRNQINRHACMHVQVAPYIYVVAHCLAIRTSHRETGGHACWSTLSCLSGIQTARRLSGTSGHRLSRRDAVYLGQGWCSKGSCEGKGASENKEGSNRGTETYEKEANSTYKISIKSCSISLETRLLLR